MKGLQVPIISNCATTGHKLQGKTVETLLAAHWHYRQNWPYVVLSRVKTMDGLHLLELLSDDQDHYSVPADLVHLVASLQHDREPDYDLSDEYILRQ